MESRVALQGMGKERRSGHLAVVQGLTQDRSGRRVLPCPEMLGALTFDRSRLFGIRLVPLAPLRVFTQMDSIPQQEQEEKGKGQECSCTMAQSVLGMRLPPPPTAFAEGRGGGGGGGFATPSAGTSLARQGVIDRRRLRTPKWALGSGGRKETGRDEVKPSCEQTFLPLGFF